VIFSSLTYILFLLIVVLLYWNLPERFRIPLLLVASYVFYMSWSPPFGILYAPVIFFDSVYFYLLSLAMVRWPQHKKPILAFGVTTELMLLGYFKYANFMAGTVDTVAHWLNLPAPGWHVNVFLPLAISFTNFVLISYLVDVYRGEEKPARFMKFATYVAYFPHLIAGPVVRAKELIHQFDQRQKFDWNLVLRGVDLFMAGLLLKLVVADNLAPMVDLIFSTPQLQAFDSGWLGVYGFALQVFGDFAGYTLMAQGSARFMGLSLPDNFDAPFFATSIQDFWRRWHMSLSRWLRDYLFIPLGGSRKGEFMTHVNLWITMGLCGLWHGAAWTFVAFGLMQGALLSVNRISDKIGLSRWIPSVVGMVLTFHLFCFTLAVFRSQSLGAAWTYLGHLLNPAYRIDVLNHPELTAVLSPKLLAALIVLYFIGHGAIRLIKHYQLTEVFLRPQALVWQRSVAYFALLYVGLTWETQSQTFIYFQF
jgi:D-alanyl-lipoteichoic acid acyltransferase DltB (MBOAT superfamily)